MSGSHSRFAPSSAKRNTSCPASLRLNEREQDEPSYEAVEGTIAHYAHELWLIEGKRPQHLVGLPVMCYLAKSELTTCEWIIIQESYNDPRGEIIVTDEMLDHLEESIMRCLEAPGEHYPEQKVDISPWCPRWDERGRPMPKQTGTSDHFACSPGLLYVDDLKYGTGVQVFAERNLQAIKYALGVINEYDWMYDFDKVVIRIMQPRLNHYDVWETTKAELLEIGEWIRAQYELALGPNPPFGPTEEACIFCKVRYKCPGLEAEVMKHFDGDEFSTPQDIKEEIELMSLERMVEVYKMRALFKIWIGGIEGQIEKMLKSDRDSVPGLKLVNKTAHRKWRAGIDVASELEFAGIEPEQIYKPREIISPAQAEKLLPKADRDIIKELAFKPLGDPLVVDADDKRSDYQSENDSLANEHFDDES